MQKYMNERGQIGVLVTDCHGAGWSSDQGGFSREFLVMDAGLVRLALAKASESEVEAYLIERGIMSGKSGEPRVYMGGWEHISVEWLPQGARFIIREYDGYESVALVDHLQIFTA